LRDASRAILGARRVILKRVAGRGKNVADRDGEGRANSVCGDGS
jgi:hypothetical protein